LPRFTEPEVTAKAGIKTLFYLIPKTLLFALDHLHLASIFSSMGCKKVYRIIVQGVPSSQNPCLSLGVIDNMLSRTALTSIPHASPVGLLTSAHRVLAGDPLSNNSSTWRWGSI